MMRIDDISPGLHVLTASEPVDGSVSWVPPGASGFEPYNVFLLCAEDRALLVKPIGDLNLSVRARKCMTKLGINTLGELLSRTGDELLECKNFGVTSLNEVREKLRELNLKLKNE